MCTNNRVQLARARIRQNIINYNIIKRSRYNSRTQSKENDYQSARYYPRRFYYMRFDNFISNDPKVMYYYITALQRPLQNARVARINMHQHADDARRAAKIFHRTTSVTPAEAARVCRCPMVKLATVDQLSWPFCATTRARRVSSRNAPTFRAWKTFRGLIRGRSAFSSPENYSCSGLGKHDVKRFWTINY